MGPLLLHPSTTTSLSVAGVSLLSCASGQVSQGGFRVVSLLRINIKAVSVTASQNKLGWRVDLDRASGRYSATLLFECSSRPVVIQVEAPAGQVQLVGCVPTASVQESKYQAILASAVEGGILSLAPSRGEFLKHKIAALLGQ